MTLRECYIEHSYYYPKLEAEMSQIAERKGLNGLSSEAIGAFCNGVLGDLGLDTAKDYRDRLDEFQFFVSGVAWALKHCLADSSKILDTRF